jgi:phospholipase/carboxylesterase
MATERWNVARLGALADEWVAEQEDFLASLQTYLATRVTQATPGQQQPCSYAVYMAEMTAIGERLMRFMRTIESTPWHSLQARLAEFQRDLETQFGAAVQADTERLAAIMPPPQGKTLHEAVRQALGLMHQSLQVYADLHGHFDFAAVRFVRRLVSQMQYRLYPVRLHLPELRRYWLVDNADVALCEPPPDTVCVASGIQHYAADQQRGAYTSYVPESYTADRAWPLLLTLHGGSGNDEDFLWTWLKYAKSRGYILVSAKSFASTWYQWDAPSLLLILEEMQARYNVDRHRILLAGLSDGGSFGYEVGFAFPEHFAGLAVVAGILRPHQRHPQASALPVYIAHGDRDALFPIDFIRLVVAQLRSWGHNVTYHEIAGFGHAYPPGENTAILDWFTALPTRAQE